MFLRNVGCNSTDTRRHIPEDDTLHNHRCENLKSYMFNNKSHYKVIFWSEVMLVRGNIKRTDSKIRNEPS
jgi:hypothetical protein